MTEIIIPIITGIVCLAVGVVIGFLYRKSVAEKAIGDAETEATRIINEAIKAGETKKRESVLEAKDEIHRQRVEADRELKERRNETQQLERRLIQREEALDKKSDTLDRKNEELSRHLESVQKKENELQRIKDEQVERLEQIASMTRDEAREMLVNSIEAEAQHDAAVKVREINQRLKDESEQTAREIISTAIQRCAADHVSEATVSVVPLPNDEMKGRIIGREGRNIRTLETLTGVDLIIDDTPEAITLSSFDPVRREIARLALEKLIVDGRIHPARIEEMVEKSRREVEQIIKSEGERATFETGIHGIHPELIKILGRLRYRTSYGQNVLQHSIEVAHIAGMMASELGLDPVQARRAGLLHDIGKAIDHEVDLRRPSGRTPRERRELHQASGKAGKHRKRNAGRFELVCDPGRPRDPHHRQPGQGIRRCNGSARARHRQEDRERAGLPRPDQGQHGPRDPRHRLRKVRSYPLV